MLACGGPAPTLTGVLGGSSDKVPLAMQIRLLTWINTASCEQLPCFRELRDAA
jgi:hypothetical protein